MLSAYQSALTIGEHTGLPVFQDFVKLLTELLVARVTEQVILPAFGVEMLKKEEIKPKFIKCNQCKLWHGMVYKD